MWIQLCSPNFLQGSSLQNICWYLISIIRIMSWTTEKNKDKISLKKLQLYKTGFSLMTQMVKDLSTRLQTQVWSLGRDDPWRREWKHTPVFLPGEFHGQRSLVHYSPWGHKESYVTEATFTLSLILDGRWHISFTYTYHPINVTFYLKHGAVLNSAHILFQVFFMHL